MSTFSDSDQKNTKASILLVEDDTNLNLALTEMLQFYGYNVTGVYNGSEALEALHRFVPDVIICDIAMPVMDGYTFLQRLRSDPDFRLLPVIFLTAYGTAENQRRAKEIGVEDYLTKPVDPKDLVASIENVLKRRRLIEEEIERNLEQLRNQIVGLLQHEFRNPLTFILGYAELLAASDDGNFSAEELRTMAQAILQGGRRLQHLIENFLLMAELQNRSGKLQHVEAVSAFSLWRTIAQDLSDSAGPLSLDIQLSDQKNDRIIEVDVRLLSEALRRLCEFAQRISRAEGEEIGVGLTSSGPYIGFSVHSDSAELMTLPHHEEAETAVNAWIEQIDTDLSLTIVRSVARLHGGRLTVESEAEKALTLTLWVPVSAEEENESDAQSG
jgi:CheY-like chemotaxis protein